MDGRHEAQSRDNQDSNNIIDYQRGLPIFQSTIVDVFAGAEKSMYFFGECIVPHCITMEILLSMQ
jgi:hypothetical protein